MILLCLKYSSNLSFLLFKCQNVKNCMNILAGCSSFIAFNEIHLSIFSAVSILLSVIKNNKDTAIFHFLKIQKLFLFELK